MAAYPRLPDLMRAVNSEQGLVEQIVPYLTEVWLDDYYRHTPDAEVVETTVSEFNYLFDLELQRLIAAWGISRGRHAGARDKSRMAGSPLSAGPRYHRGHAIPHTLGGPTDINLVPQLGKVNVGPFRLLEKQAVATPGSLYFTHWSYVGSALARDGRPAQTPSGVDQGLLVRGQPPLIRIDHHGN